MTVFKKILFLISFAPLLVSGQVTYQLNGDAAVNTSGSRCFTLTDTTALQAGSVWGSQQINLTQPFELYATVNFGNQDTNGGDGIAFSFHQMGIFALSSGPGRMGFQGFNPSLTAEFDTHENPAFSDPANDHIALVLNGNTNHSSPATLAGPMSFAASGNINVEDGNDHEIHIKWNPTTNNLKVWFDCDLRIDYTDDIVSNVFYGDPNVNWGFSGGTSNAVDNLQTICYHYLRLDDYLADTTLCQGVPLTVSASYGSSYSWGPTTGVSNPSIPNPTITPSSTTTYTVTITDSCNYSRTDDYIHTILDTNYIELVGDTFTCDGTLIPLQLNVQGEAPYSLTVFDGTTVLNFNLDANGNDIVTGQTPAVNVNGPATWQITGFNGNNSCSNNWAGTHVVYNDITLNNTIATVDALCNGDCNGSASITIPHATSSYTYIWPNFTSGSSKSGLCAKSYTVTISNGAGCTDSVQLSIGEPSPIQITGIQDTNWVCINEFRTFTANATGGTAPHTYQWSNGDLGSTTSLSNTKTTTYRVSVFDVNGCGPTIDTFKLNVYDSLQVSTSPSTGLCEGDSVTIVANASGGSGNYFYSWSNGATTAFQSVKPSATTSYFITLTDDCNSPEAVNYTDVEVDPAINDSIGVDRPACEGKEVTIYLADYYPQYTYQFFYGDNEFGDPGSATFTHTYTDTGCYTLAVNITGRYCQDSRTRNCGVYINPTPTADFTYFPENPSTIENSFVDFTNTSINANNYDWLVDGVVVSNQLDLNYEFGDSGSYDVDLIAFNQFRCSDTTSATIDVVFEDPAIYIPNSFTPNGDGLNDFFTPIVYTKEVVGFDLSIYDRWGELIFTSRDYATPWNGTKDNSGGKPTRGLYFYKTSIVDDLGNKFYYEGQVFLIY
mgnify:FL=1